MTHWSDIIGHADNIRRLKTMIAAGRVSHALLFFGLAGIGKVKTAQAFAAALLCHEATGEPCGECVSCRHLAHGTHPDYVTVVPDGASIKIEQIRLLQHEAALAAYLGMYKVFVIQDAECMTLPAANSLLKLLEEPPSRVVFVLASSRRHMLPDTVVSRCRLYGFQPLPWRELAAALTAGGVPSDRAELVARLSGGRMGVAMIYLEPDGLQARQQAADILFRLPQTGMHAIWETAAATDKLGRGEAAALLQQLTFLLRDMLVLPVCRDDSLLMNVDLAEPMRRQGVFWSERALVAAMKEVGQAQRAVFANANLRLLFEALLIKLGELAVSAHSSDG